MGLIKNQMNWEKSTNLFNTEKEIFRLFIYWKNFFDAKTFVAGLLCEKCPRKSITIRLKKVKNWIMSSKSVTVLVKKSWNLKNVFKKRYDSFKKKVKHSNMISKSVTVFFTKKMKIWKIGGDRYFEILKLRILK